jgi:hypothetical protein
MQATYRATKQRDTWRRIAEQALFLAQHGENPPGSDGTETWGHLEGRMRLLTCSEDGHVGIDTASGMCGGCGTQFLVDNVYDCGCVTGRSLPDHAVFAVPCFEHRESR